MFKGELFSWKENRCLKSTPAHSQSVNCIVSRKGATKGLITGGNDGMVIFWDQNLKKIKQINLSQEKARPLNVKVNLIFFFF
jgi:WD40 repeat protein